jgi:hypothetical protein
MEEIDKLYYESDGDHDDELFYANTDANIAFEKMVVKENYYDRIISELDGGFFKKFGTNVKECSYSSVGGFDIEDFLVKKLINIELFDAYGSGLYKLTKDGKPFHLLSNYDNGSDKPSNDSVMSLMIADPETNEVFLSDIEYQKESMTYKLIDMQVGEFSTRLLKHGSISKFNGKRSFHWKIGRLKIIWFI